MSPLTSARSGQGKAKPCCGHESMLANHPDKRSLYKRALPCFQKCLLRSKILLSISAPRPFSASVPLPCDRRPPQTATGRRRAAQTALWGPDAPKRPQDAGERPRRLSGGQMPPNGHRTPESGPDGHRTPESGPDGSLGARCPQTATGRRRAAQTALWGPDAPKRPQDAGERPRRLSGGQMPPNGHRTPESGPDGSLGARCPQTATGRRRAAQTATGRRRPPLFSARSQPLVLTRLEGVDPPWNPLFLSNPSRACARLRVRARIMRPRARFWPS